MKKYNYPSITFFFVFTFRQFTFINRNFRVVNNIRWLLSIVWKGHPMCLPFQWIFIIFSRATFVSLKFTKKNNSKINSGNCSEGVQKVKKYSCQYTLFITCRRRGSRQGWRYRKVESIPHIIQPSSPERSSTDETSLNINPLNVSVISTMQETFQPTIHDFLPLFQPSLRARSTIRSSTMARNRWTNFPP